jgi:hypothetical protein
MVAQWRVQKVARAAANRQQSESEEYAYGPTDAAVATVRKRLNRFSDKDQLNATTIGRTIDVPIKSI